MLRDSRCFHQDFHNLQIIHFELDLENTTIANPPKRFEMDKKKEETEEERGEKVDLPQDTTTTRTCDCCDASSTCKNASTEEPEIQQVSGPSPPAVVAAAASSYADIKKQNVKTQQKITSEFESSKQLKELGVGNNPVWKDGTTADPHKELDAYLEELILADFRRNIIIGLGVRNHLQKYIDTYRRLRDTPYKGVQLSKRTILSQLRTEMNIYGPRKSDVDARTLAALLHSVALQMVERALGSKWESTARVEFKTEKEAQEFVERHGPLKFGDRRITPK